MSGTRSSNPGPRKPTKSPKTRAARGSRWRRWVQRLLILGIVGVLLMVAVFYFAYRSTTIPQPNSVYQAQSTLVYYSNGKNKLGTFATQNRESVSLDKIAKPMQDAVVAAEDRTFWTNKGIDPKGILRAAFSNAKGNATQGASTITQQYVKILYLTQQRTIKRKIKEAFLSLKIQQQESKQQILEGYLNTIYFGRGSYGIQAAAQAYFNEDAKDLKPAQAAMLAAIINSPNYLSPDGSKDGRQALLDRYDYVLDGMVQAGTLDAGVRDKIQGKLPKVVKPSTLDAYGGQRGFMMTLVKDQLIKIGFSQEQIDTGGLRVTTTLTRKGMGATKRGVLEQRPKGLPNLHVASASIDVKTGALIGFYGGQNYLKSQLNWAKIGDAPGSAFKPFALATGIEAGFSLKDTFDGNSPYKFPDGLTVKNEGEGTGENLGSHISLLEATEKSVNTAYVDMTAAIPHGPQKVKDTAIKMGIPADTSGLDANATIALGQATVSPISMANSYSTIANGGKAHPWYVIKSVKRASDGKTLWAHHKKTTRAIPDDVSRDVSYALQETVKNGTGQNALALGRPAAGKTGTATNDKGMVISSWFVGYTPQVSTAVMYVRGNGRKTLEGYLPEFFGAVYPCKTWTSVMDKLLAGEPSESFPPPANLDGTAPTSGHEPYTPPPQPKPKPKPKHKKTASPTPTPTPSPTPTKTKGPKPKPTPTPTSSTPVPGANQSQGAGRRRPQRTRA